MKNLRKGFTLVEIMIVVLIIGVLLAIAVPNFLNARTTSQTKACIANLKQIESAKEQYMMNTKTYVAGTAITAANIAPAYIKVMPTCPAGGTIAIGDDATSPTCTVAGHVLP